MYPSHVNDALSYLPRRSPVEYAKGDTIYAGLSEALYLVACGRVKVSITNESGTEAMVGIVPPKKLFGETAVLGSLPTRERAEAIDRVQLMHWTREEIERQIGLEPRLGLSLVQLAERLGDRQPDGALRMSALTHHLIAAHVGTSREIVSTQMSRLRRLGMVRYSRQFIDVEGDAMGGAPALLGFHSRRTGPPQRAADRGSAYGSTSPDRIAALVKSAALPAFNLTRMCAR